MDIYCLRKKKRTANLLFNNTVLTTINKQLTEHYNIGYDTHVKKQEFK